MNSAQTQDYDVQIVYLYSRIYYKAQLSIVCDIEKIFELLEICFYVIANVKSYNDNITGEEVGEMVRI